MLFIGDPISSTFAGHQEERSYPRPARRDGRIITIIIFRMTPTAFIPAIHPVEESGVGATRQAPMDGGEDNGDAKKTVAAPDDDRQRSRA